MNTHSAIEIDLLADLTMYNAAKHVMTCFIISIQQTFSALSFPKWLHGRWSIERKSAKNNKFIEVKTGRALIKAIQTGKRHFYISTNNTETPPLKATEPQPIVANTWTIAVPQKVERAWFTTSVPDKYCNSSLHVADHTDSVRAAIYLNILKPARKQCTLYYAASYWTSQELYFWDSILLRLLKLHTKIYIVISTRIADSQQQNYIDLRERLHYLRNAYRNLFYIWIIPAPAIGIWHLKLLLIILSRHAYIVYSTSRNDTVNADANSWDAGLGVFTRERPVAAFNLMEAAQKQKRVFPEKRDAVWAAIKHPIDIDEKWMESKSKPGADTLYFAVGENIPKHINPTKKSSKAKMKQFTELTSNELANVVEYIINNINDTNEFVANKRENLYFHKDNIINYMFSQNWNGCFDFESKTLTTEISNVLRENISSTALEKLRKEIVSFDMKLFDSMEIKQFSVRPVVIRNEPQIQRATNTKETNSESAHIATQKQNEILDKMHNRRFYEFVEQAITLTNNQIAANMSRLQQNEIMSFLKSVQRLNADTFKPLNKKTFSDIIVGQSLSSAGTARKLFYQIRALIVERKLSDLTNDEFYFIVAQGIDAINQENRTATFKAINPAQTIGWMKDLRMNGRRFVDEYQYRDVGGNIKMIFEYLNQCDIEATLCLMSKQADIEYNTDSDIEMNQMVASDMYGDDKENNNTININDAKRQTIKRRKRSIRKRAMSEICQTLNRNIQLENSYKPQMASIYKQAREECGGRYNSKRSALRLGMLRKDAQIQRASQTETKSESDDIEKEKQNEFKPADNEYDDDSDIDMILNDINGDDMGKTETILPKRRSDRLRLKNRRFKHKREESDDYNDESDNYNHSKPKKAKPKKAKPKQKKAKPKPKKAKTKPIKKQKKDKSKQIKLSKCDEIAKCHAIYKFNKSDWQYHRDRFHKSISDYNSPLYYGMSLQADRNPEKHFPGCKLVNFDDIENDEFPFSCKICGFRSNALSGLLRDIWPHVCYYLNIKQNGKISKFADKDFYRNHFEEKTNET